ncbi:MAG: PKD domain-containing protein [Thermoplasmata archaeon]|nr:PKD domain-containing protein [Thermoplasmata archaeon]
MARSKVARLLLGSLVGVSAGLLFLALVPAHVAAAPSPICSNQLYLAASVTEGPVPLLVSFTLEVNWSSNPAINWSFGDGTTLTGVGPSFLHPSHRYASVGSYPASVGVKSGIRTGSCAVLVIVDPPALTVVVAAHPLRSIAPAAVEFTGSASGGSSTYTSELWTFSDGSASAGWNTTHSFVSPGMYRGTLAVVDSSGDMASATVWVNVTSAIPVHQASSLSPVDPFSIAAGAGAALVGAALLYVGGSPTSPRETGLDTRSPRRAVEEGEFESDDTGPLLPEGFAYRGTEPTAEHSLYLEHVPPDPDFPARSLPPPTISEIAILGYTSPFLALPAPASPTDALESPVSAPPVPEEAAREANDLRLSQRILLHIYGQGRLGDDEVATSPFTQSGMITALGTQQSLLSNVLRRMIYSGFLTQDVRHVRGASRRLRVYRLTSKGDRIAHELRDRIGKGS